MLLVSWWRHQGKLSTNVVSGAGTRLATSRPHEFLSEQGEDFRSRSGQASDEVVQRDI